MNQALASSVSNAHVGISPPDDEHCTLISRGNGSITAVGSLLPSSGEHYDFVHPQDGRTFPLTIRRVLALLVAMKTTLVETMRVRCPPPRNFQTFTTCRHASQAMGVALRCGYGSTGSTSFVPALRSAFSRKAGFFPRCTIDEACLSLVSPDVPPDQRKASGVFSTSNASQAAYQPARGECSPQGLTDATPRRDDP